MQRITVSTVAVSAASAGGRRLRVMPGAWYALVASGLADVAATGLYAASTMKGSLAIAAVVSSLYPVVTVTLALTLLHERLSNVQLAGVALALAGTVVLAGVA